MEKAQVGLQLRQDGDKLLIANGAARQKLAHLLAPSGRGVSVNFATANGSATSNSDYFAANGSVFFSPGQTTREITVLVRGDKKKESNETFAVNLSGANNATITDTQAIGTILNDDGNVGKGRPHSASLFDALFDIDADDDD